MFQITHWFVNTPFTLFCVYNARVWPLIWQWLLGCDDQSLHSRSKSKTTNSLLKSFRTTSIHPSIHPSIHLLIKESYSAIFSPLTYYLAPKIGTPLNKLAKPTPQAISEHVPIKLITTTIKTVAAFGPTPNRLWKKLRILSKTGDIAMERAKRAGRRMLSAKVNPA